MKAGNSQYLRAKWHQPTGDPRGEAHSYAAIVWENRHVLLQLKWIRYILYIFVFFVGMTSFSLRNGSHRITGSFNRHLFVEIELQGLKMWKQNVKHCSSGDTKPWSYYGVYLLNWWKQHCCINALWYPPHHWIPRGLSIFIGKISSVWTTIFFFFLPKNRGPFLYAIMWYHFLPRSILA